MLTFVFDEDVPNRLIRAAARHNVSGSPWVIGYVAVGKPGGPPKRTQDPDLLLWAEAEDRLIVSRDKSTMPIHLTNHLAAGRHSPGVLFIRRRFQLPDVIDALALIAHAGDPADFYDDWDFIPF